MNEEIKKPGTRRMPNLNPLSAKQLRDAECDRVYIYNVSPREHRIHVGRLYVIPACPAGRAVSKPLVIDGVVYTTGVKKVSGLDVEYEWVGTDGIDVAKDIVGTAPFLDRSADLWPLGVFIAAGEQPTDAEIAAAKEQWLKRCGEKVREADDAYAINNGRVDLGGGRTTSNIGADAIEAAKILGLDRPWASNETMQRRCEECGTSNVQTAARCRNNECRCIFDEAKARQRFPEMFAHERLAVATAAAATGKPGA